MSKLTILSLFVLAVFFWTRVPALGVPPTIEGFSRGSNTPELHIEAYYDLLCPDSKNSWNILEPLLSTTYNINNNQTLRFTIHLVPLPYHMHSFIMAQGANVIANQANHASDVYNYMGLIFDLQDSYQTPTTYNMSQKQVHDSLASYVISHFPYVTYFFEDALTYGTDYDTKTRISWAYAMYNKVAATPTFFANGVEINGAFSFTSQDWQNFINGGYKDFLRKAFGGNIAPRFGQRYRF